MKNRKIRLITLTLLSIVFVPLVSKAQFTISGKIPGLNDGVVYLDCYRHLDSVMVSRGSFLFKGFPLDAPDYCTIYTKDNEFGMRFWVNDGEDVKITREKGAKVQITGAKTEDEYQLYRMHMQPMWNEQKVLINQADEALKAGDIDRQRTLQQEFETILKFKEDSVFIEFVKAHPSSYVALNHIYNCRVLNKYEFPRYDAMVRHLTPGAFKGPQWNTFIEIYNKDKSMQPGGAMPDFSLPDASGKLVSLSQFRGKYILLTIGSSTLPDYIEMLPGKKELYKLYGTKNLEIVDVLLDEADNAPLKVMANYDVPWTLLSDGKGWYTPILKMLGIDHICQNFLIDPQGEIVARNIFGEELKQEVEDCFE